MPAKSSRMCSEFGATSHDFLPLPFEHKAFRHHSRIIIRLWTGSTLDNFGDHADIAEPFQKMFSQQRNVLTGLGKGRGAEFHDLQPIIKIQPEPSHWIRSSMLRFVAATMRTS